MLREEAVAVGGAAVAPIAAEPPPESTPSGSEDAALPAPRWVPGGGRGGGVVDRGRSAYTESTFTHGVRRRDVPGGARRRKGTA